MAKHCAADINAKCRAWIIRLALRYFDKLYDILEIEKRVIKVEIQMYQASVETSNKCWITYCQTSEADKCFNRNKTRSVL